jgi:hypothetical protein
MPEEKERTPVVVVARSHARACWWVVRHGCRKECWRMQCFVEQPRKGCAPISFSLAQAGNDEGSTEDGPIDPLASRLVLVSRLLLRTGTYRCGIESRRRAIFDTG